MSRVKIAQQGCRCKNSQRAKNLTPLDFGKLFGFVKQFIPEFGKNEDFTPIFETKYTKRCIFWCVVGKGQI